MLKVPHHSCASAAREADVAGAHTTEGIAAGTAGAGEARRQAASFLSLQSASMPHGGPLPLKSYSSTVVGGHDLTPQFRAEDLPPGAKSFLLIARDADAVVGTPVGGRDGRALPLWVVANISPMEFNSIETSGRTVVPYRGPDPQDDFIHRIYFRLYSLSDTVKEPHVQNWNTLSEWMARHGMEHGESEKGQFAEFMATAVKRVPRQAYRQFLDAAVR